MMPTALSRAEWDAYDREFPAPTFFARPRWTYAMERAFPQHVAEAVVLDDVLFPALRVSPGRLQRWREYRAMPLGAYSAMLARGGGLASPDAVTRAFGILNERGLDRLVTTPWPLAPFDLPDVAGLARVPHETAVIDLREGFDAAFSRFKGVTRRMVGQAERRGVTCAPHAGQAAIDVYYAIVLESTARWGLSQPPFSKALLEAIVHCGGDQVEIWLVTYEGETIAGGVVLYGGDELFFWSAAMRAEFSALRPSNALNAALLRAAADRGLSWYNLGASEGLPSVARFKDSLGAQTLPYVTLRYESPGYALYTRVTKSLQRFRSAG